MVLTALVGPTQAAEHQVRGFNGHATGQAAFVPDTSCVGLQLRTVSTGAGVTSPVGPVSLAASHCSGDHIAGTMTFTGTHGTVTIAYEGDCTPYQPGVTLVECVLPFEVMTGTGRYSGVSGGSGLLLATVVPQAGTTPWPAVWTWKGRIQL